MQGTYRLAYRASDFKPRANNDRFAMAAGASSPRLCAYRAACHIAKVQSKLQPACAVLHRHLDRLKAYRQVG